MRILPSAILLASALAISTASAENYAEGQVWSYKARPGESGSTLLINKIESDPKLGAIYHISVLGVLVKNRHAPSGVTHELPHLPVSKQTLEVSCIKLLGQSKPNPGYLEGYAEWKRAFDQGHAGVFTIPVSEIVGIVESTINK
ncbi:MAG TPA: hypothetical protein VFR91_00655 [Dyella sp.]|nr:hypothetical protein [Dyella sp.]